jgi:hypothetical protein
MTGAAMAVEANKRVRNVVVVAENCILMEVYFLFLFV